MSPTMARAKSKRRVHKDQLAMAVRKNFNALGVTESDVIVDWLYKTKHQGAQTVCEALKWPTLTNHQQTRSFAYDSRRNNESELEFAHITHINLRFTLEPFLRYPVAAR